MNIYGEEEARYEKLKRSARKAFHTCYVIGGRENNKQTNASTKMDKNHHAFATEHNVRSRNTWNGDTYEGGLAG